MTRRARFAMSTPWREGRATGSSSSPDDRHPEGLGNSSGQLGRHYTTKMFAHVNGLFPGVNFNRHTGPAA